jgi:O-succinylbenzoic acid--CoA ligase
MSLCFWILNSPNSFTVKFYDFRNDCSGLATALRSDETFAIVGFAARETVSGFASRATFPALPSHVWLATSGTSGACKLVALSREALRASAVEVNRRLQATDGDVWINPLPCHHVGGLSIYARAQLSGSKVIQFAPWHPHDFLRQAEAAGATLASLVPTQVHDLIAARLQCPASLRAVMVGGAAIDDGLHQRAVSLGWPLLRSYGLTEAASQVATESRPEISTAVGLPLLDHFEARVSGEGVLELRGPSLLTGWMIFGNDGTARWEDPKRNGWFRTSDRVELRGRELRVLGRVDDLVKIRGELVDIGALETALQARVTGGRVVIHCLPDDRTGAALRVVAENAVALDQVLGCSAEIFPPYARPREIIEGRVETTALGKTLRRPAGWRRRRGREQRSPRS